MSTPVKILVLEDNPVDAELAIRQLRRAGFEPDWKRVETEDEFLAGLDASPDIILADYSLPHFNGMLAAKLVRQRGLDIPFILVSGTVGEEIAVTAIRNGANDYLMKDRIGRLGPAVERLLEEKRLREERRRAEEVQRLAESRYLLQRNALIELAGFQVDRGTSISGTVQKLTEIAATTLGVARVSVWRFNAERTAIRCMDLYEANCKQHCAGMELMASEHATYFETLREMKILAVTNSADDARTSEFFEKYLKKYGITSILNTPVHLNDAHEGAVCYAQVGPARQWTADEQAFAVAVANQVSLALEASQRRQAEEQLRGAHAQLEQMLTYSPAVTYRLRIAGNTIVPLHTSENIKDMLGFDIKETLDFAWWKGQLHPDDFKHAIASIAGTIEHGETHICYRLRHKSGHYVWVDDNRRLLRNASGEPTEIIGVFIDVTERKHLQDEARQTAATLRLIIDNIPSYIFWKDKNLRYLGCNSQFARLAGVKDTAEIIGKSDYDLSWRANADAYRLDDRHVIDNNTPKLDYDEALFRPDGNVNWLRTSKVPFADADQNTIGVLGIFSDVTQRKRTDEKLRQLSRAVEQSPTSIVITDVHGHIEYVNPKFSELTGYAPEEVKGQNPRFLKSGETPPSVYKAMWQTILAGKDWHGEFLNRKKNGELFWEQASISPIFNEEGKITHFVSVKLDITARKQTDHALQLAALVYEHSAEAMLVTDKDNNILAINPAFTQMTGYTLDEVFQQNPRILSSGRQSPAFYAAMWQMINTTGSWRGELWNRRKNGEVFPEWVSINRLVNHDGSVKGYVALFTDITQKKKSEDIIWHQANFDALTQLPNRSMFQDRLSQEIKKSKRDGAQLLLLYVDLDRFKDINDTLGHEAGDVLLVEAASRISSCVRETDTVARIGGDEFTVMLTGVHEREHIERIIENINAALAEPFYVGNEKCFISCSIGVARYPSDSEDLRGLMKHADVAMYSAKKSGGNRYGYCDAALQENAQKRLKLIGDLRTALENKQLHVYYQPIVALPTGAIHKAEALLRWAHPRLGLIGPAEFIPLAEESGLINSIGSWVFTEAIAEIDRLRKLYHLELEISVNKSPVQFRANNEYYRTWLDQLSALGLPGKSIVVEITEGLLLDASPIVKEKLRAFHTAGVQLALDDFGTGYSSLSYLNKFKMDYLKIDQSFVRHIESDANSLALCEVMINMAHKLGLKVIAEGVETASQRNLLLGAGCDFAQGYLFSRPVPVNEFEALLAKSAFATV